MCLTDDMTQHLCEIVLATVSQSNCGLAERQAQNAQGEALSQIGQVLSTELCVFQEANACRRPSFDPIDATIFAINVDGGAIVLERDDLVRIEIDELGRSLAECHDKSGSFGIVVEYE